MNDVRLQLYEAEMVILGSVFLDPATIKELTVQPHQLSDYKNRMILQAFYEMDAAAKPIEIAAFLEHIGEENLDSVGGFSYLMEVSGSTPTTSHLRHYEQLVLEQFQQRSSVEIGARLANGLDATEGIRALQDVLEVGVQKKDGRIRDGLIRYYNRVLNGTGGMTGISTGYRDLDKLTNGLQRTDFIVVAARPSVGKTAFATNIAANVVKKLKADNTYTEGATVGIFSAEMSEEQLIGRMASAGARIDSKRINNALNDFTPADWKKFSAAIDELSHSELFIFDQAPIYLSEIWREARKLRRENPNGDLVIVIDYLQLIKADGKFPSRREEVDEISRSFKALAKDINAPVIALSQLSRGLEQRQDKRPMLSDLRESGGIEQDADIVMFLYRDDYYDAETEDKNVIEVIVAKHRNGPTGTVKLAYIRDVSKMLTIDWTGV